MKLAELLERLDYTELSGCDEGLSITSLTNDSRQVTTGAMFVAIAGAMLDGHHFAAKAVENGAACIVHERAVDVPAGFCRIRVPDTRKAYPLLAALISGMPSERLRVIGVTGTNGKTSFVLLLDSILRAATYSPAVLGTLGARLPLPSPEADPLSFTGRGLTTPDAADLQAIIRRCADLGATHLVMEASSHAIDQRRMDYVHFLGRAFTNLSQDHLDYHGTMERYAEVKRSLFYKPEYGTPEYAVINADDACGQDLLAGLGYPALSYGISGNAALSAEILQQDLSGTTAAFRLRPGPPLSEALDELEFELRTSLIGRFNIHNILAAVGAALMEGVSASAACAGVEALHFIPGRLQRVENTRGINVFVDYAHTPDALANVLSALREVAGGAKIICVFGCGGDRDHSKRPLMGRVVATLADSMIITNDNPRSENPMAIINDILSGLPAAGGQSRTVEADRKLAIKAALAQASKGDAVLIAGKGHEDYQIFADRTEHFSDVEAAGDLLA